MELKQLARTLGLPETADEAAVNAKLAELNASKEEAENMRKENEALKLAQITAAVDAAVAAKKIRADQKDHFLNLGKKVGIEDLNKTLSAMYPAVKLSETLSTEPAPGKTPPRARGKSAWMRSEPISRNNNHKNPLSAMAIKVENTNYNGEVLERILTVAATGNELVSKGLIMVIPVWRRA